MATERIKTKERVDQPGRSFDQILAERALLAKAARREVLKVTMRAAKWRKDHPVEMPVDEEGTPRMFTPDDLRPAQVYEDGAGGLITVVEGYTPWKSTKPGEKLKCMVLTIRSGALVSPKELSDAMDGAEEDGLRESDIFTETGTPTTVFVLYRDKTADSKYSANGVAVAVKAGEYYYQEPAVEQMSQMYAVARLGGGVAGKNGDSALETANRIFDALSAKTTRLVATYKLGGLIEDFEFVGDQTGTLN
ncbi:MAG: hypothetical protein WC686_03760 [Candidatus Shapirobacteria bacterium]|jgi:hypothetical protein